MNFPKRLNENVFSEENVFILSSQGLLGMVGLVGMASLAQSPYPLTVLKS